LLERGEQEDIAQRVGKSRSVVANSLRLLDLHSQVQTYLVKGRLSVGHAKVLLALQNPDEQLLIAERTIRESERQDCPRYEGCSVGTHASRVLFRKARSGFEFRVSSSEP